MNPSMANSGDYVLARGMRDTRGALKRWSRRPSEVLVPWFLLSAVIALGLLGAVLAIGSIVTPDFTFLSIAGYTHDANPDDFTRILARNSLVLALHGFACVAGFIAGSSMKHEAARRSGFSAWIHEKAGVAAIAWVGLVTTFSLLTQAFALGQTGAQIADQIGVPLWQLMLMVLPHALPELIALFLPLAAWLIASRRDGWEDLLAATFVTITVAIPILVATAFVELTLFPMLLEQASPVPADPWAQVN